VGFRPQVAEGDGVRDLMRRLLPGGLAWVPDGGGGLTAELNAQQRHEPAIAGSSSHQVQ
jgi:hypothetical protein